MVLSKYKIIKAPSLSSTVLTVLLREKQVRLIPQFTGRKPKNPYNLPNTFTIPSFYYNISPYK